MKVSMIVPAYNAGPFLKKCLDSLVRQTLEETEIVCVNDGSTDSTLEIMRSYQETYSRVKVLSQENGGLSVARNAGMGAASGDYICFVDSDDWLDLDAVEKLYVAATAKQADVVYFAGRTEFESKRVEEHFPQYRDTYRRCGNGGQVLSGPEMLRFLKNQNCYYPSACLQFYRRAFLEENGIRFIPQMLHEDNPFSFEVILKAGRACVMEEAFYHRLLRNDSISTVPKTWKHFEGHLITIRKEMLLLQELFSDGENERFDDGCKIVTDVLEAAAVIWEELSGEEKKRLLGKIQIEDQVLVKTLMLPYFQGRKNNREAGEWINAINREKQQYLETVRRQEREIADLKREYAILAEHKKRSDEAVNAIRMSKAYRIGQMFVFPAAWVKKQIKRQK